MALARQGDKDALCEVGRRYLQGTQGFAKYIDLGLEYLSHPSLEKSDRCLRIIAETLTLGELVQRGLTQALASAAQAGSASACLKLGVWHALTCKDEASSRQLWRRALEAGCENASLALDALGAGHETPLIAALSALSHLLDIDAYGAVEHALVHAIRAADAERLARVLAFAIHLPLKPTPELCDAVCHALVTLQHRRNTLPPMDTGRLQPLLEDCVKRGNPAAALLLGRALCGIDTAFSPARDLVSKRNVRGGTALLLRAADAGLGEAWLLLHRVHADGQGSVANPQAARFFLEKAAASGNVNAQRQLGALILKSALDIDEFEMGMHWMTQASGRGDAIATHLLRTFVLPVRGTEQEADLAIGEIARRTPWLGHRLRVSRDFGLTRTEAMCVDLVAGLRPWGLVVSSEAADQRLRSRFSRAIPALEPRFLDRLRESADFFRLSGESGVPSSLDRRNRGQKLRYALECSGFHESIFFAQVPTSVIASLRQGPSWAHGVRQTLRSAMAS